MLVEIRKVLVHVGLNKVDTVGSGFMILSNLVIC